MSADFLQTLFRERRELRKVGCCRPTAQDIADVAEYVGKKFGSGLLDDIRPMCVKDDPEWAMCLLSYIVSTNGQLPRFTRAEWLEKLNRVSNPTERGSIMNELVVKHVIEVKGLDELVAALTAVAVKMDKPLMAVAPAQVEAAAAVAAAVPAEPAKEPVKRTRAAKVEKPAEPAPAPVAEPEADPDESFGEPAAPAVPEKKWTLEELRAEATSAQNRLAKEMGADKYVNPGPKGAFLKKMWAMGGVVSGDPKNPATITAIKPETYGKLIEFFRTVSAKDLV